MKKHHRIKSHVRFTIFVTLVMILCLSTVVSVFGKDADAMTKQTYTEIRIQTGDTLWELAKAYGPKDEDIRQVIYAICEINHITADELQSGQTIQIPKYL